MDQKRLFLAIAVSLAILLGFQMLIAPHLPKPPPQQTAQNIQTAEHPVTTPREGGPAAAVPPASANEPANVPRVKIDAPRVEGSINLLGAKLDDLVLKDYREQIAPDSPLVRLLEPRSQDHPYYIQYGWTAPDGQTLKLPSNDTTWTASSSELAPGKPVTLSWDNGAGLTFQIGFNVDDNYMFSVTQTVRNAPASQSRCSRGRASAATTSPRSKDTTCCSRVCWASSTVPCRRRRTTRRSLKATRTTASPTSRP